MNIQRIPNPDNVPGSVTSGYQQQNVNICTIQTGLDTTEPFDNGVNIVIPVGGVVEVNGVMFSITSTITLPKTFGANIAHWVAINDNNDGTATASVVNRPGAWDSAKQGCYTTNNRRTLNWVSLGDLQFPPTFSPEYASPSIGGRYITSLQPGWKHISLRSGNGNGGGQNGTAGGNRSGGAGLNPGQGGAGGGGGVANTSNTVTGLYLHKHGNVFIHVGRNGTNGTSGGNGGAGGNSHADDGGTQANAGGGGGGGPGGGSGAGEETSFYSGSFILQTQRVPAGAMGLVANGGNNGGASGVAGGRNDMGSPFPGGTAGRPGTNIENAGNGFSGNDIAGTSPGRGAGGGGGGIGGMGLNGWDRAGTNIPGGFCNVFAIAN